MERPIMSSTKKRARPHARGGPEVTGALNDVDASTILVRRDVVAGRLKAAVWAWRLRVPHGPAAHRYLAALERQLAAHVARNLEAMLWQGWPPDQAQAAAVEWLHDLADTTARMALGSEAGR
jgi:hypothetical protein